MIGVNESFRLLDVYLEVALTRFAVGLDDAKIVCSVADGRQF
jgi:hypothetical protein